MHPSSPTYPPWSGRDLPTSVDGTRVLSGVFDGYLYTSSDSGARRGLVLHHDLRRNHIILVGTTNHYEGAEGPEVYAPLP